MRTYNFIATIQVEAENEEEAYDKLEQKLEGNPPLSEVWNWNLDPMDSDELNEE
jgi:hypothetical protein